MKKIGIFIAMLLFSCVLVFSFAACNFTTSGGDSGSDIIEPDDNENASVFLTVSTMNSTTERNVMQQWINAFQKKNPEVSIEIVKTMGGMEDLISWDTSNELPDITWTTSDTHSPYSSRGYFQDLSDESKFPGSAEFFEGFYDVLMDDTHYSAADEGIWMVPRDYNKVVIYLNKTVFDELGIDIPNNDWTWQDFLNICQRLMEGKCKKAIDWESTWPTLNTPMVYNYGARILDEEGYFAFDDENAEACWDFFSEFFGEDGYAISGTAGSIFRSYSGNLSSAVPMFISVRSRLPEVMQAAYNGGWEVEAVAFPNFKQPDGSAGYAGVGCSGYAITKACTNETKLEWAWKFLQWCMSEEGYEAVGNLGTITPALTSLRNTGNWTQYEYNGLTVRSSAFVDSTTKDLDLQYYNVVDVKYHANIISLVKTMWTNIGADFTSTVNSFKQNYEALTGKVS